MNKSTNEVVRDIKIVSEYFFHWFQNNNTKANPDKFYLPLFNLPILIARELMYAIRKLKTFFMKNCLA